MSLRLLVALGSGLSSLALALAAPVPALADTATHGLAGGGTTLESTGGVRHQFTLGESTASGELTSASGDLHLVGGFGSALLATPVPEPGGALLLASGAAGLALLGRLRQRRLARLAAGAGIGART